MTLRVGRVKDNGGSPCVELAHFLLAMDPQVLVSVTLLGRAAANTDNKHFNLRVLDGFIEDQAFLPSYDLTSPSPPSPVR